MYVASPQKREWCEKNFFLSVIWRLLPGILLFGLTSMYIDSPKSVVRCGQFIKHLKLEIAPPPGREMFSDRGSSESDYLVSR